MKYNLEISFHEYDRSEAIFYAEDLYISDIIEILKQYSLNPCYHITIMKRYEKGVSNNGNAKQ